MRDGGTAHGARFQPMVELRLDIPTALLATASRGASGGSVAAVALGEAGASAYVKVTDKSRVAGLADHMVDRNLKG